MKCFRINQSICLCGVFFKAMSKAAVKIAGDLLSNPLCEQDQAFLESIISLDTAMKRMEAFNQEKVRIVPLCLHTVISTSLQQSGLYINTHMRRSVLNGSITFSFSAVPETGSVLCFLVDLSNIFFFFFLLFLQYQQSRCLVWIFGTK